MPSHPLSRPRHDQSLIRVLVVALAGLLSAGAWSGVALADTPTGALSGVVRDASGTPQANAQVVLADPSGATAATDTTGSGGRYSLRVAPGTYDLGVVTADSTVRRVARVRGVDVGPDTTLDVVVLDGSTTEPGRFAAAAAPEAPQEPSDPPATVTWTGTVRHNGVPTAGASINVYDNGTVPGAESDDQGHFELHVTPGHHRLDVYAYIGALLDCDSGGCTPGTYVTVPDFEITSDRTMDIDIPTSEFTVHVVDADGQPTAAEVSGTSGRDTEAPVTIFPGGAGHGSLSDDAATDLGGTGALLIFPGSPPSTVYATSGYGEGSATVAPSDRSVTVRLVANVMLSGTVRDARGPLPLVNWPWISFGGPAWRYSEFTGDHLRPDGTYYLDTQPGQRTLTITDEPDFDEDTTDQYATSPTLPTVWTITTQLDMTASTTLDLTIPDAAPVQFRTVDTEGQPRPVSYFNVTTSHSVELAPGVTGAATAESHGAATDGRFEHKVFGAAQAGGYFNIYNASGQPVGGATFSSLPLTPGRDVVLAAASLYSGGDVVPPAPTTTTTTTTTVTSPVGTGAHPPADDPGAHTTSQTSGPSGYWALSADGHVYNFGDATPLGNGTTGAVDLEPTPSGTGYWILHRNGAIQPFGDAAALGDVETARLVAGEHPASLSATPTGRGYWVFTDRGGAIPFGDAPFLGDMSGTKLNGPVLGSVATPSGKGYYMVASDGGIFAFGDATFAGSMGGKKLNAPVQSLVPDADGKGYWLVASDGGIFAFDAPFRGSMGGKALNKPVVGMVRYGDGYLMVGADGGIFNFSTAPFAGSLGDKPPATPVVAVAALS